MIVEIISVGTEILLGDILDTNSQYLAEQLTGLGYDIHYINSVGDNRKRLYNIIKNAGNRSDIVILTGGLGPTDDDISREIISKVSGRKLELHSDLLENLKNFFKHKSNYMSKNNVKQAFLPEGALDLKNEIGTAPGILLETDNYTLIAMPGVPREMKNIFENQVKPYLKYKNQEIIKSKTLNFFSIGESSLEMKIKDILNEQKNPTYALLAGTGEVKLRITAKGMSEKVVNKLIKDGENKIYTRVGEYIYGYNDQGLGKIVGNLLKEKKLTISVAESCTGGLIGNRITDIAGSSQYFMGGFIVYSNDAKVKQLNVKEETLKKYGAVSEKTAREMALNIREIMGSDIGISITGIAGPEGGSQEKPVGLVYIGLSSQKVIKVFKLNLNGNREWNKWMSSQYALYYVYKYL